MEQRLGRGLDSLIANTLQAKGQAAPQELALSDIRINPRQPRRLIDDEGLAGLAASIATHGLLQPIVVRRVEDGYEIVAGERRFRASRLAGRNSINATVVDADGIRSLELALVENIQRENLSALDEAAAYQQLLQSMGLTHLELAERVGKSRTAITNSLRLLELPDSVREHMVSGDLSAGQARAILGAGSAEKMSTLADSAIGNQWTVRDVEEQVRRAKPPEKRQRKRRGAATAGDIQTPGLMKNARRYEDELRLRFGTKVQINESRGRGEIRLAFYSAEDRDRLLDTLMRVPLTDLR